MADDTRSRLGRGLAALIGDVGAEQSAERIGKTQRRVPVERLRPNPRNPRRSFTEADLAELAQSIKERGIIQPVVVRVSRAQPDAFEIIAGERRWRAAQRAGLHQIPVVVVDVSDSEALQLAIIENVQRADLNPLEEATGYLTLSTQYNHNQDDIAGIVGKSRSHVANTLRLLKLPESVKSYIVSGKLSAGHARALIGHPDPEEMAREIVSKGLNVRQVEALQQEHKKPKKGKARARSRKDADTAAAEKRLSDALGLTVEIDHRGRGGAMHIRYKTLDQLEDVIRRLEGRR